jgi:hypothetical protein
MILEGRVEAARRKAGPPLDWCGIESASIKSLAPPQEPVV